MTAKQIKTKTKLRAPSQTLQGLWLPQVSVSVNMVPKRKLDVNNTLQMTKKSKICVDCSDESQGTTRTDFGMVKIIAVHMIL